MKHQTLIIAGAAGFIGSFAAHAFSEKGYQVIGVSRTPRPTPYKLVNADLAAAGSFESIVQEFSPDLVLNAAGVVPQNSDEPQEHNLRITENISSALALSPKKTRLVHLGTVEEVGPSQRAAKNSSEIEFGSEYALNKIASTMHLRRMCETSTFECVVLRPTTVFGPGQTGGMFIPSLVQAFLSGVPFESENGAIHRDFLYVSDLISCIESAFAVKLPEPFTALEVGSGVATRLYEVANTAAEILSCPAAKLVNFRTVHEVPDTSPSGISSTAQAVLGFVPRVDLRQGLAATVDAHR